MFHYIFICVALCHGGKIYSPKKEYLVALFREKMTENRIASRPIATDAEAKKATETKALLLTAPLVLTN